MYSHVFQRLSLVMHLFRTRISKYFESYPIAVPAITSEWQDSEKVEVAGDFYVSTKGDDENPGTKDAPFLTIKRAIEAVKTIDKKDKSGITILIESGEYRIDTISLSVLGSDENCPIEFVGYGEGETVINKASTHLF